MLMEPSYFDLDPLELCEDVRLRANQLINDGHLTQRDLATMTGVSYTTLTLWLRGQRALYSLPNLAMVWMVVQDQEEQYYDVG